MMKRFDKQKEPAALSYSKAAGSKWARGYVCYALHRVSTSGTGFMIGNSIMYYLITVHDTFDFAYDNNYDDLFTTTVNNWAWLCQQTHVLNPIEINLSTAIG